MVNASSKKVEANYIEFYSLQVKDPYLKGNREGRSTIEWELRKQLCEKFS